MKYKQFELYMTSKRPSNAEAIAETYRNYHGNYYENEAPTKRNLTKGVVIA